MEAFGTLAPVVRSPLCLLVDKSLAIKCQTDPIIHLGDTLFSSEKSPPLFLPSPSSVSNLVAFQSRRTISKKLVNTEGEGKKKKKIRKEKEGS